MYERELKMKIEEKLKIANEGGSFDEENSS